MNMSITSALVLINAGHSIQRDTYSNQNGNKPLHLKTFDGRKYLFAGDSPAELDWDDLSATDWKLIDANLPELAGKPNDSSSAASLAGL